MNSLFSIFDPISNFGLFLNWAVLGLVILAPSYYWMTGSKYMSLLYCMFFMLTKELKMVLNKGSSSSMALVLVAMFMFIFTNNFYGLLPYVFTASSHLAMCLSLSLPIWVGYTLWNFFKNTSIFLSHLAPEGAPKLLIPFMVLIEVTSMAMRPFTLAVRLTANMTAGHLMLTLTSGPMHSMPAYALSAAFTLLLILIMMEVFISLIQAYVFMTLSSLYIDEMNNINN